MIEYAVFGNICMIEYAISTFYILRYKKMGESTIRYKNKESKKPKPLALPIFKIKSFLTLDS